MLVASVKLHSSGWRNTTAPRLWDSKVVFPVIVLCASDILPKRVAKSAWWTAASAEALDKLTDAHVGAQEEVGTATAPTALSADPKLHILVLFSLWKEALASASTTTSSATTTAWGKARQKTDQRPGPPGTSAAWSCVLVRSIMFRLGSIMTGAQEIARVDDDEAGILVPDEVGI